MTRQQITIDGRDELTDALGISRSDVGERPTLSELRQTVETETDPEFASMGEAIRDDMSGALDADLHASELSAFEEQIARLPEVRDAGIPAGAEEPEALYREIVQPAWRLYDHLVEAGFFESLEERLPRFTPEHIEQTAHELVRLDALSEELDGLGFDEREKTVLVMNVVNNNTRLARWVPTKEIPSDVEFDVEHVPPLHKRAMGGALLWVNSMDVHLWQKEVLVTEEILDDGYWDVKAMLAGVDLIARAALDVAEDGPMSDSQLVAALTGGAAIAIVNQEEICKDVYWITEEKRNPSPAR